MTEEKKTILVVDDTPLQALLVRRVLESNGFSVTTAKDGQEALDRLKKTNFDLVITDINMPQMDGIELCKAIRADERLKFLPVILNTVLSDAKDLIAGIAAGANNYLTKPCHEKKLLGLVDELIGAKLMEVENQTTPEIIEYKKNKYTISASKQNVISFLLSTYDNIHVQNEELLSLKEELQKSNNSLIIANKEQEALMLSIFPKKIVEELLAYGSATPAYVQTAVVGFVDFVNFTQSSLGLAPQSLVDLLSYYFENFDRIVTQFGFERIKTIGDGYMFAGGISSSKDTIYQDAIGVALEIRKFVRDSFAALTRQHGLAWQARIGIHMGPVISGVIGKVRPAYDIWGETVNIASKLEHASKPDKINISQELYEQIKEDFLCTPHGVLPASTDQKQGITMYFVENK